MVRKRQKYRSTLALVSRRDSIERRLRSVEDIQRGLGTRLHLLDDAGILFGESSQNLYVLNATAAFVWSCVEDGLGRDQIVAAVEQAYDITGAAVATQIDALFRRWAELGLLVGTEQNRRRRPAPEDGQERKSVEEWPGTAPLPSHSERAYRLLTTSFRVRYDSAAQEATVHPVLAHLETSSPATAPAIAVDLVCVGEAHFLLLDGGLKERCARLDELAPMVKWVLLAEAINRYRYLLYIHAGVVRSPGGCLLLPAPAGSGKTSLTAALVRAGFVYLSDEVALLEEELSRVRPVPVSLCIKDSAWDLLAPRYPELRHLAVHYRFDGKVVRYLNPPPEALDPDPETSHPVRWIVFPRHTPGAPTVLRPLRRADALHRLIEQCLAMPKPLDQPKVASLVRWIADIPCFEMPLSSLDEAVALLHELCQCGQ